MSTILIRRGPGTPGTGILASNELGWDVTNNVLYVGVDASDPIKIVDSFQDYLSIDQSTGAIVSTGTLTVGDTTTINAEIWQPQTAGVYDVGGTPTNASARWNAAANYAETSVYSLTEHAVQTVTNSATTVYTDTYNINFVQVYLNRLRLRKTEYTATNGTSVDISYPLEIGDEIEVVTAGIA
jgi:hypothetical protein